METCISKPNKRNFTYQAIVNRQYIMSRLDRIYTSEQTATVTFDWKIKQMSVPMDHWLVAAKYAPAHAPNVGKGRWTFQTSETKNKDLTERIVNQGKQLNADLIHLRDSQTLQEERNPQMLWATFKNNVVKVAKKHCSKMKGRIAKKINDLEKDLKSLRENPDLDKDNKV